ncbi:Transcription initiation factor TFIID subunit 2 [Cichlidogyrus casuarinus]|uniref:Transcription initiation factor TFIID subunit 2 n=1 Tax=Cichlidogyrus casuarinus TaxID=1844966 RepID=A0ABD2QMC9_9PLAT
MSESTDRQYRLAHQVLSITNIDLSQQVLIGFTQLILWPLVPNLKQINLNCKQCRLHRILIEAVDDNIEQIEAVSTVQASRKKPLTELPDPADLPFAFSDPSLEICKRDTKFRTLDSYENRHAIIVAMTDADQGTGEITFKIPSKYYGIISRQRPVKITVEFSLNQPKGGVYFINSCGDGSNQERGAHMYTATSINSSRLWFPCIDCSEPCTWKIEVTVDEDLIAVASGELVDPPQFTEDLRGKTYQFIITQPVSAPYIGLAVGAFEAFADPKLTSDAVTYFCPAGFLPLLKHTIAPLADIIEYYEGILATQLPFQNMKAVFVENALSDYQSFASLMIFSVELLHSSRIIEQAIVSRKIFSHAVAEQFFGCFLPMKNFKDAWLPLGFASYLSGLYQKRAFGNNEYRHLIASEMHAVTNYEHNKHGIVLDPSQTNVKTTYFNLKLPQVISPDYMLAYRKKAHLVVRMLELRLGQPILLQVLNKLLVLARLAVDYVNNQTSVQSSDSCQSPTSAKNPQEMDAFVNEIMEPGTHRCLTDDLHINLLLSTESFRRIIRTVTGQDIHSFLEFWVLRPGHLRLMVKFNFNRKRNIVELDLKQDLQSSSTLNYTGPISVTMQEVDGSFIHTFKLEEGRTIRDLTCHSKSRKHKKKKITLSNGDEVDIDLAMMDQDSPLLWIRLDPDLAVIRHIRTDMPDVMWHLMAVYDRDCLGQLEAIGALADFASQEARIVLSNVIADERIFYRVRMDACYAICRVVNELSSMGTMNSSQVTNCLISYFWQLFSSPASRGTIRQNDFSYMQHYFLQKAMVRAVSTLRVQQVCPKEVLTFLVEISRYNDNSRNTYSDCYYRAELIKAMKDSLTPAIAMRGILSSAALTSEAKMVLEEVTRCLNHDTQIPSYKNIVSSACLLALRRMQKHGFLPSESKLFQYFVEPGHYFGLRMTAIECMVDFVRVERDNVLLDWIFEKLVENEDQEYAPPRLRFETAKLLIKMPPFQKSDNANRLDTPQLVDRLWRLMNYSCAADSQLRCAIADLYFMLYKNCRPGCLPLPEGVLLLKVKEGKSMVKMGSQDTEVNLEDETRQFGGVDDDFYRDDMLSSKRALSSLFDEGGPSKRRTERLSDDDSSLD